MQDHAIQDAWKIFYLEKTMDLTMKPKILPKSFFSRDASIVARDLLGKILVHNSREGRTAGKIVETEAYYGTRDPASRAFRRTPMSEIMWGPPARTFVYMIHANWMFNIVTGKKGEPSAVLIRALEPIQGIELMQSRRGVEKVEELCRGPGRLTKAMGLNKKDHHAIDVTKSSDVFVLDSRETPKIGRSHRIGVEGRDLKRKLRFFVKGNKFISR